jgi:Asp-tRNA(Asn)/Glu-tRNA(Gln) amidotransferase A subunit family amidase
MTEATIPHTTSRRDILRGAGVSLAGLAVAACSGEKAPPATADGISTRTIHDAEELAGISYTDAEREQMVSDLEARLDILKQLRSVEKPNALAPATVFEPRLPGVNYGITPTSKVTVSPTGPAARPTDDDIAFATLTQLATWLGAGSLSSRELTDIYLKRIGLIAPRLECFVTVMADRARREADAMDAERAAGSVRGPLHGIPYALKDLFDADGSPTTWGAAPFRNQASHGDSTIVRRLGEAGAILLGKTTCGALAYGDVWFGGVTRNPFDPREGSSGSSAGSASATAAGLCAFAIGTETLGSLVSPSMRCGTTALRPTFGRVSRAGGMALCWSLDKAGPIARSVEDCALVLDALNAFDPADAGSIAAGFTYDYRTPISGLRLGIDSAWLEEATDTERAAIETAKGLGATLVDFKRPDLASDPLSLQLTAEAAAAFEDLTLSGRDDELTWQDPEAWPNSFRGARFISAVDLIQVDRLRRMWMLAMHEAFDGVDVVIGPSYSSRMLTPTNFTGHPCLVMRCGFDETTPRTLFDAEANPDAPTARTPVAISLWAPLFREGPMLAFGRALESALNVASERPAL